MSGLPPIQVSGTKNGSLEYISGDVTNQKGMWATVENIVDREGRIDICVANAGILRGAECLEYPGDEFQKVCPIWSDKSRTQGHAQLMDVNVNGVLFTAQAAGRQMARLNIAGSIVMTASMSGSITNMVVLFCLGLTSSR